MTTLRHHDMLTGFVRDTLGCGCPDRVFEKIETGKLLLDHFARQATRIVVGDTLLIYIIFPETDRELSGQAGKLAVLGRRDRDTHRYNRFRLVVAYESDPAVQGEAAAGFAEAAGSDEKLHIHFVEPEAVTAF